jgi:hypothetical protein
MAKTLATIWSAPTKSLSPIVLAWEYSVHGTLAAMRVKWPFGNEFLWSHFKMSHDMVGYVFFRMSKLITSKPNSCKRFPTEWLPENKSKALYTFIDGLGFECEKDNVGDNELM